MNTYKCKEIKLRSTVGNNSFVPRIWGKHDLLWTEKQPPVRVERDPSSLQEGREKLLKELTAIATECKEMQEAFTMITQNLAEKVTLLTNESQKE